MSIAIAYFNNNTRPDWMPGGITEDAVVLRAIKAYMRHQSKHGFVATQPSHELSCLYLYGGRFYAVLRNINGLLAVYRYDYQGRLRRLKRWPKGATT